jgi:hypothetical protein
VRDTKTIAQEILSVVRIVLKRHSVGKEPANIKDERLADKV